MNALVAAQAVLIPVQAEPRSIRATERMLGAVQLAQRKLKRPALRILGLLLTMTSPNNVAREAVETLRATYGDLVLTTTIGRRVAEHLEQFVPRVQAVIQQTTRRVLHGEQGPAREKLVSIFEPESAIICVDRCTSINRRAWCG